VIRDTGENASVTFQNVDTGALGPGDYTHTIASANDSDSGQLTVEPEPTEATFQVNNIQPADATVVNGTLVDISADIENVGDQQGTQDITLSIENSTGAVVFSQTKQDVTRTAGENASVTFQNVDTGALGPGDYTHEIASVNDSDSGSLTVQAPPNFQVNNIQPADATVVNRTLVDISADIENIGGRQGTQDITLSIENSTGVEVLSRTQQDVIRDAGENASVTFQNVDTGALGPGDYTHEIASVNDSDSGSLTVEPEPTEATFLVSNIQPADAAVPNGTLVDISADIENVGDQQGTQDITLSVDGFSRTTTETVAGGASTTVTFSDVDTGALGPGDYIHTITSANDSDSGQLTVQTPPNFQFDSLIPTDETVVEGEEIDIFAIIRNTGDMQGTQTVTLTVGSITRQQSVTISGNDFQLVTFQSVDTGALGPGQYTYEIQTANDRISGNLTVQNQANFQVSDVQLSAGTVTSGNRVDISANVTNVGDIQGTQTVSLAVGSVNDSDTRQLGAGVSERVTFTDVLIALDAGEYAPTVSTANDSANSTLTVLEPATVDLRWTDEGTGVRVFTNTTVQVVVTGASNGIESYDFDVALNNTAASLLDYELTSQGSGATDNSTISPDNSSISFDVEGVAQAGSPEVVLANLTLKFNGTGAAQVDLPGNVSLTDASDRPYDTSVNGTTVFTFGPPPVIPEPGPPQNRLPLDRDGDGLYEDVRGDGFKILDVQALFNNLEEPAVTENAEFFYFQPRQNPQSPKISDVQALFNILNTGTSS